MNLLCLSRLTPQVGMRMFLRVVIVAITLITWRPQSIGAAPPIFQNLPASVSVTSDVTSAATLYTAVATDPGSITYTCTVTPDDGKFTACGGGSIGYGSNPSFSHVTTPQYVVMVTATNPGGESSSGNLTVSIVNPGGAPNFTNLPFSMALAEGLAVGTFVYQVKGTIPTGATGITFGIQTAYPLVGSSHFSITSGGTLTTAAILDADQNAPVTYTIEVSVCDTFPSALCSYDNLTVTISEANDPPVFTPSSVTMEIAEDMALGTVLPPAWVITDEDGDFIFSYSINPTGVASSYFSVNPSSGNINLTQSLDYDDTALFPDHRVTIELSASDPHGLIGYLNLTVVITDVNDCPPVFDMTSCTGKLKEGDVIGTQVLTLNTTDCDVTEAFRKVSYSVTSPMDLTFTLVPGPDSSVTMTTREVINRESIDNLQGLMGVEVVAMDTGNLTSSIFCLVEVEDINEFNPFFPQSVYRYDVRHDAEMGTSIARLVATDDDATGIPLMYEAENISQALLVGYYDGQIMVTGTLSKGASYTFNVSATDSGTPPRKTSSPAEVTVVTFDPVPFLTDWTIDTGGAYFSRNMEATLEANIAATCYPCTPHVAEVYQSPVNSDHYVVRLYIMEGEANATTTWKMMPKEEVLARYTIGDGKTPTSVTASLGPGTYPVISVQESYMVNWWLDTPEGIATTVVLTMLLAAILITTVAYLSYRYWWHYRPENREYLTST